MVAGIAKHTQRYGKPSTDSIPLEISTPVDEGESCEECEPTDNPPDPDSEA